MEAAAGDDTGRERVVARVVDALGARRPPATAHGVAVLVRGPWASGTSWVLRSVAAGLRRRRVPTTIVVAGGRSGRLPRGLTEAGAAGRDGVLVVDDAHRLDEDEADALRDAVLNGGSRIVLGARSPMPLPDALDWLTTAGVVEVVELEPVDAPALVARLTGGQVHAGTVHRIGALAGGRAGFVVDLVTAGTEAGAIVRRNGLWRLAGPLDTSLVGQRTASEHRRLGPELAAAHRTLALAGPLTLPVARRVVGEEGLAGLVSGGHATVSSGGQEVSVEPPVVADALRDGGASLTADQARILVELDPQARADVLVARRLAAGDAPTAAEVEEAARVAWAAGDPHQALALVGRAGDRASALRLEAELLADLGRRAEAISVLERLEAVAEPALREAAAAERATITMWLGQRERALAISRATAEVEGASPAAVVAHALLALEGGDPAGAAATAEPLLAEPSTAGAATSIIATSAALRGEGRRAVDLAEEACRLLGGPQVAPDVATITLVLALVEAGELAEARRVADDGYEVALGASRSAQAWMALCRLRVALGTGDLAGAASHGLEAAELFADLDHHAALRWALAGRLLAAAGLGDEAAVAAIDADLVGLGDSGVQFLEPDVLRARAWAASTAGDPHAARRWLCAAVDLAGAASSSALAATALHDLVRLGAAAEAAPPLAELAGAVDSRWMRPRVDHAVGLVESDPHRIVRAAGEFHELGALLHAREAAVGAAVTARATGDREAERQAHAVLHRLPPQPEARTPALAGRPSRNHELSPRECQVTELAATGRANQEIATELGISVRTVENLLHRAYHKLGVAGRSDLPGVLATGAGPSPLV